MSKSVLLGILGGLAPRFHIISIADIFWLIGFFFSIMAMIIGLILYSLIINRFFCSSNSKEYQSGDTNHSKYRITKLSATLSATFSLSCIILLFTTFPICTTFYCGYNFIGNFYFCAVIDTYILSKLMVYTLFIDRIYNDYFRKIYFYSSKILYLLLFMVILVIVTLIIFNTFSALNFQGDSIHLLGKISVIVFISMDITFSLSTLFLFIKPIYSQTNSDQNKQYMKHKIVKYALLSTFAIMSSLIYEVTYAIRIFTGLYHSDSNASNDYMDISSMLQVMDCVVSMFCVYFGFVERDIFDRFCKRCHACFQGIHFGIIQQRKKTIDAYNKERKPTALRDLYKQMLDNHSDDEYDEYLKEKNNYDNDKDTYTYAIHVNKHGPRDSYSETSPTTPIDDDDDTSVSILMSSDIED